MRGKIYLAILFLGAVAALAAMQSLFHGDFVRQFATILVGLGTVAITMTPVLMAAGWIGDRLGNMHLALLIGFVVGATIVVPWALKIAFEITGLTS